LGWGAGGAATIARGGLRNGHRLAGGEILGEEAGGQLGRTMKGGVRGALALSRGGGGPIVFCCLSGGGAGGGGGTPVGAQGGFPTEVGGGGGGGGGPEGIFFGEKGGTRRPPMFGAFGIPKPVHQFGGGGPTGGGGARVRGLGWDGPFFFFAVRGFGGGKKLPAWGGSHHVFWFRGGHCGEKQGGGGAPGGSARGFRKGARGNFGGGGPGAQPTPGSAGFQQTLVCTAKAPVKGGAGGGPRSGGGKGKNEKKAAPGGGRGGPHKHGPRGGLFGGRAGRGGLRWFFFVTR